ncbi:hypothetical protein LTR05_005825 [Lithohypha guttulata]|uniref:DUF521 domain protein n=1 Tax=Lithohypha guttulata TaxID=1690604 RepID=A0AAN7Y5Q7_9EURO|nr:hypothetical protein LTR05_005825 [Lithohypha guttulata]
MTLHATILVSGSTSKPLLYSTVPLSFWGGVNTSTGRIIDHTHPLHGQYLENHVLAIPSGRGSCSGSGALLELILNGCGPAGLIFRDREDILTLGVLVAKIMFEKSIPVVRLKQTKDFNQLGTGLYARIDEHEVSFSRQQIPGRSSTWLDVVRPRALDLSTRDKGMLDGEHGEAMKMAMKILIEFAKVQGAERLIDVTQAHIDACVYIGSAGLQFAQKLVSMGAKVSVPTTLNAISVDRRKWKELGVTKEVAQPAEALAQAYLDMGASMNFTCAPYLLKTAPGVGEQVGWAESNAVVFANSVLGARTQKYPDFLDVCIALTGRAPFSGCHTDEGRMPSMAITLPELSDIDDSLYPVLGYCIGKVAGPEIPYIHGLENASPRIADLKAFGAAFATTSSAPMFHIRGVTPENPNVDDNLWRMEYTSVTLEELAACFRQLTTATSSSVDLVSLGNPHFSLEEFAQLARYCCLPSHKKHPRVSVIVTTSRSTQEQAKDAGYLKRLLDFGVDVITDTCWCMIEEPVIKKDVRNLMTNSAKYAHYAPGMVKKGVHFGSLEACVEAACTGEVKGDLPGWLDMSRDTEGQPLRDEE